MAKSKLKLLVKPETLDTAKHYAEQHNTNLSSLVEAFFNSLKKVNEIPQSTPILNELAGNLKGSSLKKYHDHLHEKYLRNHDLDRRARR